MITKNIDNIASGIAIALAQFDKYFAQSELAPVSLSHAISRYASFGRGGLLIVWLRLHNSKSALAK